MTALAVTPAARQILAAVAKYLVNHRAVVKLHVVADVQHLANRPAVAKPLAVVDVSHLAVVKMPVVVANHPVAAKPPAVVDASHPVAARPLATLVAERLAVDARSLAILAVATAAAASHVADP